MPKYGASKTHTKSSSFTYRPAPINAIPIGDDMLDKASTVDTSAFLV
jgi:hypothetical protein